MKQQARYTYLGTNGTITSFVHLEGIYSVKNIVLTADEGYVLTKDGKTFYRSLTVAENEVGLWKEVSEVGQN